MERVIKVGIGGYGRSGRNIHWNYLHTDPRFKIVAVADALEERRADAAKEIDGQVYGDYREMLAAGGFDLFVNATPSRFHADASIEGLAKYDVVSEKPSAPTVAKFDEILAAAKASGHNFYPFQNSRFYQYFRKALEIANSGVLGKILCVRMNWSGFARRWDWQTRQDQMAGNLFNTGPHPVDQAIVWFGDGMPKVFARMQSEWGEFGGDSDSLTSVTLWGENKPLIEIHVSNHLAYPTGDRLNVQGTLGGLTGTNGHVKWKCFDPAKAPKHEFWKPWSDHRNYCGEQLPWEEYEWTSEEDRNNSFTVIVSGYYNSLYNVIVNGAEREIKLDQVRRQVYVMEEAYRQNPMPRKELK